MDRSSNNQRTHVVIDRVDFPKLIDCLVSLGYDVLGPVVRDGAIVYDRVSTVEQLPRGIRDHQAGGRYRLEQTESEALFTHTTSAHSWKRFLHPPRAKLWQLARGELEVAEPERESPRIALLGVRACDLQAIAIQDRVFLGGNYTDAIYRARREGALIVAVNCTEPGETCFCGSMESGPSAREGFDLALTEVAENGDHFFVAQAATEGGRKVLDGVPHREASASDLKRVTRLLESACAKMGRTLDTTKIKELLYRNVENPRWDDAASRCLTCANCTMVCPTCFCTTVEDTTDLAGQSAERWRKWDSCFTSEFSYIHGGTIRASAKARYRQWVTHKLAGWIDQFERGGCVGCGRCITWCPVGIDITEEVSAIRRSDGATLSANENDESH